MTPAAKAKGIVLPPCDPWGIACGGAYKPFIDVFEGKSSIGELNRVGKSRTTGRTHNYLSHGEYTFHYACELAPDVVDIREQYPLIPIADSLRIAKHMKVSHPWKGKEPFELTVDLVITISTPNGLRYVARSFKPAKKLFEPEVRNRLALERAVCAHRNISWKIVTDETCTSEMGARARWLFSLFKDRPKFECHPGVAERFYRALSKQHFEDPLRIVISKAAAVAGISKEDGVDTFKWLVCTKRLKVDLTTPLSLREPHLALIENF